MPSLTITRRDQAEWGYPWLWSTWLQLLTLGGLLGVLYYRILGGLFLDWWTDPNWSHGLIVPAFCAWIVWRRRDRIQAAPLRPSWWGLVIIFCAVATHLLGVLGAEVFLSRISFLFLLAGLAVQFRGWRFFRTLLFPWALLFLTVPVPAILLNQVSFPLQFLASQLASFLLKLVGVPVFRQGNIIQLPSITLEVAEACSGLRSLVSLITLAVMYGYLFEERTWRRGLLVLAAIPLAVLANGLRIVGSGLLGQYWDPRKAEGFSHLCTGWIMFLLSLGLLFLFHALLSELGRRLPRRQV